MNMVASHWSANAVVLIAYLAVVVVHLRGMRRTAVAGRSGPVKEAVAFHFGLLVILLALVSPLGYWAQRFVWVRSGQDLLLAFVAPSLIVLGAPWIPLARGLGLRWGSAAAADGSESVPKLGRPADAGTRPPPSWLSWPVVITLVFNAAWWGWHLPAVYDASVNHSAVYGAEVISYVGLGVAFWLQLIGSRPFEPRFSPLARVMLIAGTVVSDTILGMVLGFGTGLLYPAYARTGHKVLSVVGDQQVGGAVIWVLALPALIITAVALLTQWLGEEESRELGSGFDRLLKPQKSGWPSRSGLK
jgi:cytochrome c oxidase assembly factor CtaG